MTKTFLTGLFLCLIPALPLSAQSTFGSIVGNVSDAGRLAIVDAAVRITNLDEKVARDYKTTGDGHYEALNLKPGRYTIAVTHPGFQAESISDVVLLARQTVRVDLVLQVGTVEQSVTVESKAGVVNSETSTIASSYGADRACL